MKVALVCPYAWDKVGGVQSHVRALGRTLARRGHQVQILAPSSLTSPEPPPGDQVRYVGRAVGIPANGSVAPLAFGPLAAAGIRTALREFGPDVMHLHEPLIPSLSLLALLNGKAPAVGTFHASAEASLAYWASRPLLVPAMEKLAVKTVVSDAARGLISAYFPGDYLVTPNGIEFDRFARSSALDLPPARRVLFLGRLERRKGLEVLLKAMASPALRGARLTVAGKGPEERSARARARSLGVETEFLGRLDEDDLPRCYKTADVYCAPGLGGESFGIVLLEAMAAGTPVVCSDLPGYRAVARDAATLVRPGDHRALAAGLAEALERPTAERLTAAGERRARAFDWSHLAAGVESAYEEAVYAGAR